MGQTAGRLEAIFTRRDSPLPPQSGQHGEAACGVLIVTSKPCLFCGILHDGHLKCTVISTTMHPHELASPRSPASLYEAIFGPSKSGLPEYTKDQTYARDFCSKARKTAANCPLETTKETTKRNRKKAPTFNVYQRRQAGDTALTVSNKPAVAKALRSHGLGTHSGVNSTKVFIENTVLVERWYKKHSDNIGLASMTLRSSSFRHPSGNVWEIRATIGGNEKRRPRICS